MNERWKNENVTDRHGAAIAGNGGRMYFVLGKGNHVHDLFHSFCRLHLFISLSLSLPFQLRTLQELLCRTTSGCATTNQFRSDKHFLRNAREVRGACPLCPVKNSARAAALHLLSAAARRPRNLQRKLVNESDPRVETSTPLCPRARAVLGEQ